jgi:hypothetical protein
MEKPVITTNGNQTVGNDAGLCTALVTVSATATDNVSVGEPTGVRSDGLTLDAPYPVGTTTTITWNVTDVNGNAAVPVTQTVTVTNAAPVITSVTAPLAPMALGTAITLVVDYTDNNVTQATINWDDNTAPQQLPNPAARFSTPHTYAAAGVYTVSVTLTDACGQASPAVAYQYVVIYDPAAGFVTGAGWITSPAGAYAANLSASGKAHFGFQAKYQKGATVPTGNTDFEFKAVGMSFSSTTYEWLVVAGARAQFKGEGTINGSGSYGFLLTGLDGDVNGGGGTDKFRIKIWNKATSATVYDNNQGSGDDVQPSTALGGGAIVIHNPGKNTSAASSRSAATTLGSQALELRSYPNPAQGQTTLMFVLPRDGAYSLAIHDLRGALVQQLPSGQAPAGALNQVEWQVGHTPAGVYVGWLTTAEGSKAIKIIVQ